MVVDIEGEARLGRDLEERALPRVANADDRLVLAAFLHPDERDVQALARAVREPAGVCVDSSFIGSPPSLCRKERRASADPSPPSDALVDSWCRWRCCAARTYLAAKRLPAWTCRGTACAPWEPGRRPGPSTGATCRRADQAAWRPSKPTGSERRRHEHHVDTATEIRSFQIEIPEEQIDDLRRRIAATRLPTKELVDDRSQGVQLATMQELARYWTTEYDFGRIEARLNALPAVHDRDRRRGHPLHPRQVAARERAAADHDARLARLGHRAARDRRPADRPDRARRHRRGRVPPGAAVPARLRLLRASRPSSAGTPAAPHARGRS